MTHHTMSTSTTNQLSLSHDTDHHSHDVREWSFARRNLGGHDTAVDINIDAEEDVRQDVDTLYARKLLRWLETRLAQTTVDYISIA